MSNSKITKRKVLIMDKPFKSISIGDPWYFEEMDELKDATDAVQKKHLKNLKKLTVSTKPRCCKCGAVVISQEEGTFEYDNREYPIIQTIIDVYLSKDKAQLDVYLANKWYGENTVKETHELGCDTAKFDMYVDDRFLQIHTCADGYYGVAELMKEYFGFRLRMSLDADALSFDDAVRNMAYLFNIKEIAA